MALEPYRGHISLKVNNMEGYYDFELDNAGKAVLIQGPAEVMQAAKLRLTLWRGGWCLDRSHGFPWQRFLGRKDVDPELMRMVMKAVIMRDERIRRVRWLKVEQDLTDLKNRTWRVSFWAETADGSALQTEFMIRE